MLLKPGEQVKGGPQPNPIAASMEMATQRVTQQPNPGFRPVERSVPTMAVFTRFREFCIISHQLQPNLDKQVLLWSHREERYYYQPGQNYELKGKLTKESLMRKIDDLRVEECWNPVKTYQKVLSKPVIK